MATKIWVKAAHPRAHFYQEVLEPGENGRPARMVIEQVFAPTMLQDGHPDHMVQIPVPMQVTDTLAVRNALRETYPLSATDQQPVAARLVQCLDEEVVAYLKDPWHLQQMDRDTAEAERAAAEERLAALRSAAADKGSVDELRGQVAALRAQLAEVRGSADSGSGDRTETASEPATTTEPPDWFDLGRQAAEAGRDRTVPSEAGHPNGKEARQWRAGFDSVQGGGGETGQGGSA